MKTISPILISTALLLAGCSQASSPDTTTAGQAAMEMPQPAQIASATGTVESVNAATGRITLAHGPVEALGWTAMTMGFKATPQQIASVQPGQSVRFEFTAKGMEATITRIEPAAE